MKAGNIQGTKKYIYLGITLNGEGNLKGDIEQLQQKCRVKSKLFELTLFEASFMPALIYGIEACGYIKKEEMKKRIQGKPLKSIFKLPVNRVYSGILIETGVWPAEQRIEYATLTLYHNIKSCDEDRTIKKMIE